MRKLSLSNALLIASIFCVATTIAASAQTLTTLVNFDGTNGDKPGGPLVQATDGNLYGVTYFGGTSTHCPYSTGTGCGTFFKVTPSGEFTMLYSFCSLSKCSDGTNPVSLVQGTNGNFFGVTKLGGKYGTLAGYGYGTAFEITPTGVLTTLHNFCAQTGCPDGSEPYNLIQATDGNFYGTALFGGSYGKGALFQIGSTGKFTELYSFCATAGCPDGALPVGLVQASNYSLYGSTQTGGTSNGGTLFSLSPAGKFTTLHSFAHGQPNVMIQASDGNLYGTTAAGGSGSHGIVFRLTPAGKLTVLHNFCNLNCAEGNSPLAGLVQGSDSNLYGTTYLAGNTYYAGSVFELATNGAFSTLYLFCSQGGCVDGDGPGALTQATNGDFYGATSGGGSSLGGTVFTLSASLGPFVKARPSFGSAGQTITILGNNLTGATSVTFNGTAATFTVVSDTYIQARVPSGATTGKIVVTTPSVTLSSVAFLVP
jgi:uncharacterized repeat protein (TIGR03803 family)